MNNKETGGSAFPKTRTENGLDRVVQTGMTLRDYFAGQVLAGLTSATDSDGTWTGDSPSGVALESYAIADAMLKERNK